MFGIPTFDLLTDAGKQGFIEYMVNLTRKEIISYTPNYTQASADVSGYVKQVDFDNHVDRTTSVHGIADTSLLLTTADLTGVVYQNTPYLDFNIVTPGAVAEGQLAWNDTAGTLEFGLKGGNVTMPIGTRSVARVKHADNSGLTKGKVVYVVGSDGTNKTVRYALATSDATSARTFGVVSETVSGGAKGFITTQGLIENLNTSGLTEGASIWVSPSTAGELTTTKPVAPNHLVLVGWCIRSHATTGVIFVHVVNGFELDELHDVRITSVQPNDLLQYDSTIPSWKNVATIAPSSVTGTAVITSDSRLTDTRTPTDASVTSPKFNIDYATPPTVTQEGALYYNTTSDKLFVWDGSAWDEVGAGGGVPVGTIVWYAQTTPPVGFLLCNGSSQLRSAYPDLFAIIGTTYGQGSNPGTTFALPSVLSTTGIYVISTQLSPTVYTSDALFTAPVGAMIQWPITSGYPTGWLRSDGTAVSRTTYAALFSVISTTYGTGDGSTTFNLPNISGAGVGSPVYIIKATLSGTVEPSTVAHASTHIRGGSDVIDADRGQIDWVPTRYTRDSTPTEAGATTDLTAHLKGIDNWMYYGMPVFTNEAARNAAITSPVEGMRAYITAPTIPATTGGGSGVPSGITTVYNGSTWVCTTTVATWNTNTCTAQSVSAYSTCLWSGNALSVTSNTGSSALVTLTARIAAGGTQYFFAAVKPGTGNATDGFSISTQTSTGANTHCIGGTWLFTGLPAATNTFTVQMRNNGGVSMFLDQCHLTVTGVA